MSLASPAVRSAMARPAALRRVARLPRSSIRFQSSEAGSKAGGGSSHIVSGLAGGTLVLVAGYAMYSFSAAGRVHSSINKTAKEANKYYNEATKKFQESTPDANEAIEYLKKTAHSYAVFIPGGKAYVDTAFKDLDTLREKHADKVDGILRDTYTELQKATKSGLSVQTFQKVVAAFEKMSKELGSVAGDAFSSILDNHPNLKDKVGGRFDQLKQMGEQYGPQAREQVEETWKEVQDTLKGGFNADNIDKIKKLVEDKVKQIQKLGDDAWKEGVKQAQPFLDKNPKIKELIDNNADALKKGNVKELFDKVKSGKLEDLESYVNEAKEKAKKQGSDFMSGGGDLGNLFGKIPAGSEILKRLSNLREVADKHKDEGEQLLRETIDEIQKVLTEKSKKGEELLEKIKKQS